MFVYLLFEGYSVLKVISESTSARECGIEVSRKAREAHLVCMSTHLQSRSTYAEIRSAERDRGAVILWHSVPPIAFMS
jgi:hypothetical protein